MRVLAWSPSSRSAAAEEMPGRWHQVVRGVEQVAGGGEVVGGRGVACESVEGQDLDVGCVLVACLFDHRAQSGLGAVVAVFGIHRGVETGCEGGSVAAAGRLEPVVGCSHREQCSVAVAVGSQDSPEVDTAEGEEAQLPGRASDLDDAFERRNRFVDVAGLLEDTPERVEVRRSVEAYPRRSAAAAARRRWVAASSKRSSAWAM